MTTIQKILCPTDFSAGARDALLHAVELAKSFSAKIDVLHTWSLPAHVSMLELQSEGRWTAEELERLTSGEISNQMTSFLESIELPEGVDVNPWLEPGDPAEKILEAAADYDLVVMSTHGRSGLSRLMLGSIAQKVVRKAPCPVITVRMSPDAVAAEKLSAKKERNPEEKIVFALFDTAGEMADAHRALVQAGVELDDISLIITEEAYKEGTGVSETHVKEGASAGTLFGGAVGGVVGLLAVLGSGVGAGVALLVMGPAIAMAAAGGLVGGLIGWGVPSETARQIQTSINDGQSLLAVHVRDEKSMERANKLLISNAGDIVAVKAS